MAVNKVIYGDETLIDITDTTLDADKILLGYEGYDASGTKVTGRVGATVEDNIMVCNAPLFSVDDGVMVFGVSIDSNKILNIG